MAYEFKKLSAVEAIETPADTANVLIEENGVIKKTPSNVFVNNNNDSYVIEGTNGTSYRVDPELHSILLDRWDNAPANMPRIFIKWHDSIENPFLSPVYCFLVRSMGNRFRTIRLYWAMKHDSIGSTIDICATEAEAQEMESSDMA